MLLAVDVGNTQTVFGLYECEELGERWRIATEAQRTGDELGALLTDFLELKVLDAKAKQVENRFAVVPYLGPNGTRRRPIFFECRADSIVLQPEGVVVAPKAWRTACGSVSA